MIKATCVICQEFFQTDHSIYSTPCGHVFHEVCLLKWIQTSPTCPHCRHAARLKNVVRLFFETDNEDDDGLDPTKLKNELDSMSAELAGFNKLKADLVTEKEKLNSKLKKLNSEHKSMSKELQSELSTNQALRKQLKYLSIQGDEAKEAKKTAKVLHEKLSHYERLQKVLTANSEAVSEMLEEQGDNSKACRDLATYCVSLKREFENAKMNKSRLRDELAATKKELSSKTKQLNDYKIQTGNNVKQIKALEEEVSSLEKDKENLKQKLEILQRSVKSPSGAKGVISRLLFESPAPFNLKAPKLQDPEDWGSDTSLDISSHPGNPVTPDIVKPSPNAATHRECKEFGIPFIKTTSMANKVKYFFLYSCASFQI
ncbi:E3 ubiquitin-protein ligase TRAIP-like isoform X1 [Anneissia japonica]|uniref:E3 ubiquitin-protein ligase TRAIP-like isoform X1 n=1 Tax=Anneissia japonica TaxID=1529436 RepID=UPI00142563BA|nr:E3 ubiquitin-protein ligase TRAIP-like isoform X1 [Anneissia japonica]